MTIQHYPQSGGGSKEDKEQTNRQRHTLDREADREKAVPARKNTRRWCRGKVGVEHQTEWVACGTWWRGERWRLVCRECGKQLKFEWREMEP